MGQYNEVSPGKLYQAVLSRYYQLANLTLTHYPYTLYKNRQCTFENWLIKHAN